MLNPESMSLIIRAMKTKVREIYHLICGCIQDKICVHGCGYVDSQLEPGSPCTLPILFLVQVQEYYTSATAHLSGSRFPLVT